MHLVGRLKNRKWILLALLFGSSLAVAGVHAYTNNLKVTDSLYHCIYWSEIGSDYPSVRLGE